MKKILIILAVIIIFSSCSCFKVREYTDTADSIISFINSGKIEQMNSMTDIPFILDDEIIMLKGDMDIFWRNIINAGFSINDAVYTDTFDVESGDFKLFADKMEVESYFKNYITEEAKIILIEAKNFRLIFLLDENDKGEIRIKGFKGPEAL
jgi:PBP1b-binding outer membrane lipoprotein LpoB